MLMRITKIVFNLIMITYSDNPNLLPISEKLKDLIHINPYHIHFLPKNKKNKAIEMGIEGEIFPVASWESYNFAQFLINNNISYNIYINDDPLKINIGVRQDLIQNTNLCVALLKTAINVMERRIKFGNHEIDQVIKGLPVFN